MIILRMLTEISLKINKCDTAVLVSRVSIVSSVARHAKFIEYNRVQGITKEKGE